MRKQATIRIVIFCCWILFWIGSSITLLVAPLFRKEIDQADILPAIGAVASIWLPILSCFAGFWFSRDERKAATSKQLSVEQVVGAFGFSAAYLLFVFVLIFWSTYIVDYASPEYRTVGELSEKISFMGRINEVVKLSLWISPLVIAPTLALTGRAKK